MVVGEPDERSGQMHALNTLYYPDHQPVPESNRQLLRDYYRFDSLMYGITHGKGVFNTAIENAVPGYITRTYSVPAQKMLVVQMLNIENERKWTSAAPAKLLRGDQEITLDLPGGIKPQSVSFASPDDAALQKPVAIDFEVRNRELRVALPAIRSYGTLILRY
ncbi:hypothetical protein EON80_29890 [bacterium]|nr:MAG: hypothetical protein EON80_29890 [bacterium]